MKTLVQSLQPFAFPLALLALMVLSFGLLIPALGFFWDDWPVLLTHRLLGSQGFWEFYTYDRPFSAWTYVVTMPVLGYHPIAWHIFSLLLRWGACLGLWLTLRGIWPGRAREAAWVTLLFAVYPVFIQQPVSVAYSQHWITYLLYFASLAGMVYAVRRPRWFWPLTALSVAAAALHLFTMEYFAGLELARPVLLWLALSHTPSTRRARLRRAALLYLPYLAVLLAFFVWRQFLLALPGEDVNRLLVLDAMRQSPIQALVDLAVTALRDLLYMLVSAWERLLDPALVDPSRPILFAFWLVSLVSGVLAYFFLRRYRRVDADIPRAQPDRWPLLAMALGIFIILVGMLPVWLAGRQVTEGLYGNRFGLPAMFGAALFWIGLLHWLVSSPRKQALLLSVMLGLSAGMHLRVANDFRWSWIQQQRFYWELNWRAPSIAPHTPLYASGELFPLVGLYSTSAGINLLYPAGQSADLNYWFFSLGREVDFRLEEVMAADSIENGLRNFTFEGGPRGLVLYYEPGEADCLTVLSPDDADLPALDGFTRRALPLADPGRILPQPSAPPNRAIFGAEPERGWCYYYQKASLAAQLEDWEEAARLGDQARAQGFRPSRSSSDTPHEWLPFVRAYALTGQHDLAAQLSRELIAEDERIAVRLCQLWSANPPADLGCEE